MDMNSRKQAFQNIAKSKFVRAIFLRMVLIFLIVIIAIIAIAFFSFTTEINKSIVLERQKQLGVIENSVSTRMEEITSIAYNIGNDESFYLEAVKDDKYSGYEMSQILSRYLVGNDFIGLLAYYRLSEPDVVYTSCGELDLHNFWNTYLCFDSYTEEEYFKMITESTNASQIPMSTGKYGKSYITYVCALPTFTKNPQAFVIMLIPEEEIKPVLETQLTNCSGDIAIFDTSGNELYHLSTFDQKMNLNDKSSESEEFFFQNGKEYVMHKKVSPSNGWTYVSAIRLNDMISEVANKQLIFIVLLLVLMLIAIFTMLVSIIVQYKPINKLAMTLAEESGNVIDEESLLSDTFATLKDDSEQKQKFEAAFYEAEAANKAKSTFLSNMSHDIRTPMNAIVGMTEIARKHVEDTEYVKECLQNVSVASQYLLDIINNVLDMSRIESGRFTLTEDIIDLPTLVYGVTTILNHSLDVKSQKFVVEVENIVGEKVIGDNVRFTQVFMNILSNAVKFTPNGGSIHLHMSQTKSTEDGYGDYTFVFTDTGIGMSPEFTKKVFDTFSRDDKSDLSKIEGTGLGMAIAKSFVELMGGTISCESEMGKGTTFTVKMHMKLAENQKQETIDQQYQNTTVLIYGIDENICCNQKDLFEQLDVKADYALNIQDVVQSADQMRSNQKKYDLVILNQAEEDKSGAKMYSEIVAKLEDMTPSYILVTRDLFITEQAIVSNRGIAVCIQSPLFRSTVIGILNRNFEKNKKDTKPSIVNLTGKRILLVEDNKMNRKVACALIGETKAEVVEAVNGKEAVDIFKEHKVGYFSIILMDVQMPVMNGYEATVAIRSIQREDAATIPIYAMTANTFDEDVRQVKEVGMNGHLGKPYVAEELYRILEFAK